MKAKNMIMGSGKGQNPLQSDALSHPDDPVKVTHSQCSVKSLNWFGNLHSYIKRHNLRQERSPITGRRHSTSGVGDSHEEKNWFRSRTGKTFICSLTWWEASEYSDWSSLWSLYRYPVVKEICSVSKWINCCICLVWIFVHFRDDDRTLCLYFSQQKW